MSTVTVYGHGRTNYGALRLYSGPYPYRKVKSSRPSTVRYGTVLRLYTVYGREQCNYYSKTSKTSTQCTKSHCLRTRLFWSPLGFKHSRVATPNHEDATIGLTPGGWLYLVVLGHRPDRSQFLCSMFKLIVVERVLRSESRPQEEVLCLILSVAASLAGRETSYSRSASESPHFVHIQLIPRQTLISIARKPSAVPSGQFLYDLTISETCSPNSSGLAYRAQLVVL